MVKLSFLLLLEPLLLPTTPMECPGLHVPPTNSWSTLLPQQPPRFALACTSSPPPPRTLCRRHCSSQPPLWSAPACTSYPPPPRALWRHPCSSPPLLWSAPACTSSPPPPRAPWRHPCSPPMQAADWLNWRQPTIYSCQDVMTFITMTGHGK